MRRTTTFTRATSSLRAIGLVVVGALWLLPAGRAVSQAPPTAPPGPVASQPAAGLYAQGCAQLRAGDPAAAIELLTRAAAIRPDKLDYCLKLAKAYAAAGQHSAALHLLNDLAARQPQETTLRVARAEVYALDENWAAVKEELAAFEDELHAEGLVLLASAYAETQRATHALATLRRGLKRWPDSETLWLPLIEQTLDRDQCGLALQQINEAERHLGPLPRLQLLAAQAYYRSGQVLGKTRLVRVPEGHAGQFVNEWLLIEKRDEPDRFLCCPKASALYALRRALDAGLDEPAAHCLHARIWQRAGRPEIGLAILQSREAVLLENASPETLETFADVALAANALSDFLRYARLRADSQPRRRTQILYDAYLAAAERYNQRGDDATYRELLRRALRLRPENAELMLRLADTVWNAGARDEAAFWYRRVLQREPAHQERRRILRRLGD